MLQRVLFLCTGNSCRSQMAEGWANHLIANVRESFSAGTEPQPLNKRAVKVMQHYRRVRDEIKEFVIKLPRLLN